MTEIDVSTFQPIIKHIEPDGEIKSVTTLNLGFHNRSYHLETASAAYVVKTYTNYSDETFVRANKEHKVLQYVRSQGIACPEPLYFEKDDTVILVTKVIPGEQIMAHPENPLWAEKAEFLAEQLAIVHKLPVSDDLKTELPDATKAVTHFLDDGTVPDYMQAYPDGESIWSLVNEHISKTKPFDPVLVHGDYWSGNMLWVDNKLTGLLDWEMAAYGDGGFDVAYCRMEMIIDAMYDAADLFLKTYEEKIGQASR